MTINDRIEINPRIMLGKPVVRGTRITVELILRKIAENQLDQIGDTTTLADPSVVENLVKTR